MIVSIVCEEYAPSATTVRVPPDHSLYILDNLSVCYIAVLLSSRISRLPHGILQHLVMLWLTYVTRSIKVEIPPNDRSRDAIIESSLVPLNEAHLCETGQICKEKWRRELIC